MTLHDMLTQILKREGGYVDHPDDKGGPTNFGITLATLAQWRSKPVDHEDVRLLTEPEARSIYTKRYFKDPGFDLVPGEDLQAVLLDAAVNHGPAQAVKLLQGALGLVEDGILGPITRAALPHLDTRKIALRVLARRVRLYGKIISRDHSQAVFALGWANRVAEQIEGVA